MLLGRPRLVQAAVLNNRRRILTRDASGEVALWDVLSCRMLASYGVCDLEAKKRELFEPVSVPAWFTCETNSGSCHAAGTRHQSHACFTLHMPHAAVAQASDHTIQ